MSYIDNNFELTEINSNQLSELDLSNAYSHLKPASGNLLSSNRKQHEKKHKKPKILNIDDDEPSYISFYRYPIKNDEDEQKKKKELQIIDSPLEKTISTTFNKSQRRGSLYSNGLRRSFTPQKTEQSQLKQQDQIVIPQQNTFQRMQISKISKLFILKIRQLSQHYNYRHLRKVHFDLIGDLSSSTQYNTVEIISEPLFYQKQVNKLLSKIINFLNSRISSNPESKFFFIWNIVFSLTVLIYLFYLPFHYSFEQSLPYFNECIMIIFITKIFLSLIKGYYHNGELVLDIRQIAQKYLKLPFLIDLLIVISTQLNIFLFVCFLRLPFVLKTIKGVLYSFQFIRRNECIQQIFSLLIILFLQIQIGGSLFHYVGQSQLERHPENNWLHQTGIDKLPWQDRYICSIYYSFTTLMNVIYGDIHAFNHAERFTVMFVCLCSYSSFGYFVTVVGLLIQEFAVSIEEFYSKRQIIMNYMIQRSISTSNQIKVTNLINQICDFIQILNLDKLFFQIIIYL